MRIVLLSLVCASVFVCNGFAQQGEQSSAPQTWTPQTFTPQTHTPQSHSPPTWTPQIGERQGAPRRRTVRCAMGGDDFCVFTADREFRPGSPCSCNGRRGTTN